MNALKKILRFVSSMRFAIVLLVLLAVGCLIGSVIPQTQSYDYYAARYSERAAMVFLVLYFDDVFHSWWFIGITALLCVNLLACNVARAKSIWRKYKAFAQWNDALAPEVTAKDVENMHALVKSLRIAQKKTGQDAFAEKRLLCYKNRIGLWGSWICHMGMLLLIFGFALGQMTAVQYTVAGFAGDRVLVGDSGITVTIEDFTVALDENGMPTQYTSRIIAEKGGEIRNGVSKVNSPARLFGYLFSQNSYGYVAEAEILRDGKTVETLTLSPGKMASLQSRPDVTIALNSLVPANGGYTGFTYSTYVMAGYMGSRENQAIMQGEEQELIGDTSVRFHSKPYTVLVARRDVFRIPTLIGALIVLAGLILSFYVRPMKLQAVKNEDGRWLVNGYCRKGDAIFAQKLSKAAKGDDRHV